MITPNTRAWELLMHFADGRDRTAREVAEELNLDPGNAGATIHRLSVDELLEEAKNAEVRMGGNNRPAKVWQITQLGQSLVQRENAEPATEPAEEPPAAPPADPERSAPLDELIRPPRVLANAKLRPNPAPAPIDDDQAAALAEMLAERDRAERAVAAAIERGDADTTVRFEVRRGGSVYSYQAAIPDGSDYITEFQTVTRMTERMTRDALTAAYPMLSTALARNGADHG